jgi:L-amino acid N-acyltransferase YncA
MINMLYFTPIVHEDLFMVKEIYDYYILDSTATFHNEKITIDELEEIIFINNLRYPSYLIHYRDDVIGYCFLSRYKKRQAYDRTAEISVYLRPGFTGKGIGVSALKYIEEAAISGGIHVLIGTLCSENQASIRLLEKMEYTKAAHLKNVGEKFGRILDVVIYQKEI